MQDELRRQYVEALPERLKQLRTLAAGLLKGDQSAVEGIRVLAHSLHGSGATFGLPAISDAARRVEHAAPAELLKAIPELANVLKAVIEDAAHDKQHDVSVLIIEDDPAFSNMVEAVLRKRTPQARTDLARSAAEAQELLVARSYALVILDLILPDRDGREILREIRLDFQLPVPVLVFTAVDKDVVRVECMSLGADKVLLKPFDPETLGMVIENLLRKNERAQLALVPKGQEMEQAVPDKDRVKVDLTGKSVLLAEDDQTQATLVRQRLTQEGLEVVHVQNGREAMAMLRTRAFSLVILDVKMPLFDGFEVLERIRGELDLQTPVIMLTAMGSEVDIVRGYDLGANDYLLKPFNVVQLIARIKSLLK